MSPFGVVTTAANATAYSVAQQLVMTTWNIVFGIMLMAWAFGWSGGKQLVEGAYAQAKEKEAERKEAHRAKKEAERQARAAGRTEPT